jgi:hypothetical protein
MPQKLTEDDFAKAAQSLRCEVAAVKAVTEVESHGEGFLPDGRPVILFESHEFHKLTGGQYDADHANISTAAWVHNYGPAGAHQWDRLNEALELDRSAALKSTSWGLFQLMGFNYQACGFNSVTDFVAAMQQSEGQQLLAFVNFLLRTGLAIHLVARSWAKFAVGYNGPGYRQNHYDTKLAAAYARHSR